MTISNVLAALFLAASIAQSPMDRVAGDRRPVEMTASGGLSIDLAKQIGIAKGDVIIERDDVVVCCDEAEAKYEKNRIEQVTCKGRVVIVRPDGTKATAALAVFRAKEDNITLSGEARVTTESTDLTGERIIYDIARDKLTVEGSKSRFRFKPGTHAEVPARACGKTKP
jgi:lipopolysaccharide transport protein LptA